MASRISSLDRSLAEFRASKEGSHKTAGSRRDGYAETTRSAELAQSPSEASSVPVVEEARANTGYDAGESGSDDILIQKGPPSQYFNEVILSRVIEEDPNVQSALKIPSSRDLKSALSPFNVLGIISSPSWSQTPSSFHPSRPLAVKLWNVYVNNVEGCAGLRILHLPTDEVKVYSTIDDPIKASFENLALCLAIYFCATVSLDDGEAQAILGQDKSTCLLSFKLGLEQAFAQGDFLDHPTLTGLHAFVIYLSAVRVNNHGKCIWILNGLAIRIAESLGLHQDGERLGLSPFESEIRRRLWWHMISRDGRAGEDYGLETTNGLSTTTTVSLPLNVDDVELYPEMRELPLSKKGWTAMTFSLVNIDLVKSQQKLAAIAASASQSASPLNEHDRTQILSETRAQIDNRIEHYNPVIPQHRLTVHCSGFLLRKLDFITRQQWLLLRRPASREDFATEQSLVDALELLEPRIATEDDLLKQFAWARKAYQQYHVAMYILWHLCVKPEGPSVERAWRATDKLFSGELGDEFTLGGGSTKSAVLAALHAKAVFLRRKVRSNVHVPGDASNTSRYYLGFVNEEEGAERSADVPVCAPHDVGTGGFDLEIGDAEWPDWTTLLQGFQADSPVLPSFPD